LRRRTFLIGFLSWAAFMAIILLVTSSLLERGFQQVEDREFLEMRSRVGELLRDHLEQLGWKARDWGEWDAADAWVRTGKGDFPDENLNDSSLAILDEEFLAYIRADRTPVAVMGMDPLSRRSATPDTSCLLQAIPEGEVGQVTEIRRCGDSLLVVSVSQVRNSLNTRSHSGWFVIGHRLGNVQERKLGSLIGRPLRILDSLADHDDFHRSESTALLHLPLGVAGGGAVTVEVEMERPVNLVARRVRSLVLWALFAMSVCGTILSMGILELLVVRRVLKLSRDVLSHADVPGRPAGSFGDGGDDEIGALGEAIDGMVGRLVAAQARMSSALESARESAKAKSSFLAAMSHDLRTPLNGMIGLNEFLLKTPLDDAQREALDLLRSASENLLSMINDILEHSRGEAGHTDLQSEEAGTEGVFFGPIRVLAPIAHHQGLDLVLDLDPALPARLHLDSSRIRQILHNLVGNAVKFTNRGEVLVQVRQIDRTAGGCLLEVVIRDTGVGMSESDLQTIFQPFVQVSEMAGKRQGGTGLGLSIAGQLVERMGGSIEVRSVPGKGSEFRFRLEFPIGEGQGSLVENRAFADRSGVVAILVGNGSTREMVRGIVERVGLTSRIVGDAEEWLRLDDDRPPASLLVVDVESLGLGDLPRLAQFRAHPSKGRVSIVVLSRTDRFQDETLVLPFGDCEILRMPVRPTILAKAVERATHPILDILLGNLGSFLSTMVAGSLRTRGHHVFLQESDLDGTNPKLCIVDGDSPEVADEVVRMRKSHPAATLVRLGGDPRANDGVRTLERPFLPEALVRFVESSLPAR
jgi:signal transduction histidine kinase